MPRREIDKSLQAWNVRDLQTFKVIIQTLQLEGHTIDAAINYIEGLAANEQEVMQRHQAALDEWVEKAKKCPECSNPLSLGSVGPNPKGYKHQWYCPNQGCPFVEEFGTTTVEEEKELLGIKRS